MKLWTRIKLASLALIVFLGIVALQGDAEMRVEQIVASIIAFAVMLLGPKPLKAIFDLLGLPGGAVRVLATYVAAFLVGVAALAFAGLVSGVPASLDDWLALAGLLAMAVQIAYHRLKDQGQI